MSYDLHFLPTRLVNYFPHGQRSPSALLLTKAPTLYDLLILHVTLQRES